MSEKLTVNKETISSDLLEKAGDKQREVLQKKFEQEQTPERGDAERIEDNARHEALELATSKEKEQPIESTKNNTGEKIRSNKPTKHELDKSFKQTMSHIQKDMKPASRTFSKVIHNPIIDKASDVIGGTIARPNLILAGATGTIVLGSLIYFIAKFYGYTLSGTEAIAAFVFGWLIGAIIEFARVGLANKRPS